MIRNEMLIESAFYGPSWVFTYGSVAGWTRFLVIVVYAGMLLFVHILPTESDMWGGLLGERTRCMLLFLGRRI